MRTRRSRAALLFVVGLVSSSAQAASLAWNPVAPSVATGASVALALEIDALDAASSASVGGFSLTIAYDESVLAFVGAEFGPHFGAIPYTDVRQEPGRVEIAVLSLVSVASLEAMQPDAFALATLRFEAQAPGQGALTISDVILSDVLGNPLPANAAGANVTVVPEPDAALLAIAAIGGLFARKRAARMRAAGWTQSSS